MKPASLRRYTSLAATLMVAFASRAAAASPSARLVYLRDPGAETCPDEAAIRGAVSARLGYDPFFPYATATMFVEIAKESGGFRARIKLVDDDNKVRGARELHQKQGKCTELVDTMALSMSIAIDPLSLARKKSDVAANESAPEPEPPPAPPPAPESPTPPPPPPAAKEEIPESPPVHGEVAFVSGVWTGASPAVNLSLGGFARIRWRALSFAAEARFDFPASREIGGGAQVETSLTYGALVTCAHVNIWGACAVVAAGSLHAASSGVSSPKEESVFHAAVGPRGEVRVPLGTLFALVAHVDALVSLSDQTLQLNGLDVYTLPRLSAGGGVGVTLRFF